MKLKNIKIENELILRLSFGAKESLDDKLEMYIRFIEKNEKTRLKKSDLIERVVDQFLDEDKGFVRWMNENPDLVAVIRSERQDQINQKKSRKKEKSAKVTKNAHAKQEGETSDSESTKPAEGETLGNVSEFKASQPASQVASERRSETPLVAEDDSYVDANSDKKAVM